MATVLEAVTIDESFSKRVRDVMLGETQSAWFAAKELGWQLDTLELRQLETLLHGTIERCPCCKAVWVDPADPYCYPCLDSEIEAAEEDLRRLRRRRND